MFCWRINVLIRHQRTLSQQRSNRFFTIQPSFQVIDEGRRNNATTFNKRIMKSEEK